MKAVPHSLPRFLWHFITPYRWSLCGFMFVAIFWASNLSLTPYAMKLIIDRVSNTPESAVIAATFWPAVLFVTLGLFTGFVFRFYDWLAIRTYPTMKGQIVEQMFAYVENHSYHFFQQQFAGSLGNKINDMATSSATVVSHTIDHFIARGLSLIIGSITMFLVHPYFAWVLLTWSTIFVTASILLSRRAQNYSENYAEARSTVVGKIVDSIGNILNVKLFARERYERNHLRQAIDEGIKRDRKTMWYLWKIKLFYQLSITCLTLAMISLLIYGRSQNTVTVGDFALVLTLNMWMIEVVFFLAMQLVPFSEAIGTCKQALSIMSVPLEIVDQPNAQALTVSRGEIVFDRVHFQYKNGQQVFVDKSVVIPSGQRVGLVGFSGSGKSTFVNLILRFFDVDAGRILIDGQDIKSVTQESLRSQIAMIPQDPTLFHRSLSENIGYGKVGASESEIVACSKQAHCHEFIEKLADGYQSLVGERGVKLSGGQRQRVAIARAILKNAPVLILDEATSSLDSVTEHYIQQSLSSLMANRTTIVIAHRLSTLFHMDRILVFSEGRIIEDGKHADLLALNGHYAKLWSMQAGGFIGS